MSLLMHNEHKGASHKHTSSKRFKMRKRSKHDTRTHMSAELMARLPVWLRPAFDGIVGTRVETSLCQQMASGKQVGGHPGRAGAPGMPVHFGWLLEETTSGPDTRSTISADSIHDLACRSDSTRFWMGTGYKPLHSRCSHDNVAATVAIAATAWHRSLHHVSCSSCEQQAWAHVSARLG